MNRSMIITAEQLRKLDAGARRKSMLDQGVWNSKKNQTFKNKTDWSRHPKHKGSHSVDE
jgi:hypothetical protein